MNATQKLQQKKMKPESLMMSHGYEPAMYGGAIKPPIFQTSTFTFETAEAGKAYFEVAYGLREKEEHEQLGYIYSRLDNPNLSIVESRLCLWDGAEDCAMFESGMAAISTCLMEFLKPGDVLLYSNPVYGGTSHFISDILRQSGVEAIGFHPTTSPEEIEERLAVNEAYKRLKLIYIETPANPTNDIVDIELFHELAVKYARAEEKPLLVVDNTYMGPVWQQPLQHGADLVIYSATKYISGHSDVIAGACLGSSELIGRLKVLRTFLGNMAAPWTCWLLSRSLETLKPRMDLQAANANKVAQFLQEHSKVEQVNYFGLLADDSPEKMLFGKYCSAAGAMISFYLDGEEEDVFRFLNSLQLIKLAVSLGSTESLIQHPASMTHAGLPVEEKAALKITDKLVRLSVGIEHVEDIIWDLRQALVKL
ncbi:MAG: cystathionine gamma-synthase family protein [Flammeovirgaceae bacterium]